MRTRATLAILLTALTAAACSRAQAKTAPDLPPLEVPAPPPRVVEVTDPATPTSGTLVEEPARNTPRPRPPQPARVEAAKPDPVRTEPPPAVDTPAPPPAEEPVRTQAGPTLQTTPANQERDVERSIVTLIAQARERLKGVNYNRLNAGARTQYNQALLFVQTAEDELRKRNFVFAETNAEKAATLASQLAGR